MERCSKGLMPGSLWFLKSSRHNIKQIVSLKEWQQLRETLKGTWNKTPETNVQKLRYFLGETTNTDGRKLKIILNYLGALRRAGKSIKWHSSMTKLWEDVKEKTERQGKNV